ncbi:MULTISPECIES: DUF3846 domain-containing protein [Streptomyces]|uniref:DUF3846 domain-containing protein n=1 Tax=Streptomyces TaxID=1883 RepID=UPI00210AEC33|nr:MULTISPECIES: DUF3846 domain-containing protein [Streptomyces]UUA11615.1 DUF3846 domain-containing protein [Streptomyces koelreuteriae]UUA19180.1 DUF3846 domain-containing protein [Streptomyces sp. CRCS-T-1]
MSAARFALVLRPDASFSVIEWPHSTDNLNTLYCEIGCTSIAAVDLSPKVCMWLDDEGLLKNSPINHLAMLLYSISAPIHQAYHGTAVFTGGPDARGNTKGLTLDRCNALLELAGIDAPTVPNARTS